MYRYYKKTLIIVMIIFAGGCSSTPPWEHPNMSLFELQQLDAENELNEPLNPEEMHLWVPPTDTELALRRERQDKLHEVAISVDDLILNFRELQKVGNSLEDSVVASNAKLDSIDEQITNERHLNQKLERETEDLKSSVKEANSNVRKLKKRNVVKPTKRTSNNYYKNAILSFRKGNYEESILLFKKSLTVTQPQSLLDNIQFGLGSAYYKLKEYPSAIKHLDKIVNNYPVRDKWFDSHVLLGLIYSLEGQKSKSIYTIENALDNNPPSHIRKILNQLISITQEESFYAVS
jgi:tetratricopeptide (TPR) repeat protein